MDKFCNDLIKNVLKQGLEKGFSLKELQTNPSIVLSGQTKEIIIKTTEEDDYTDSLVLDHSALVKMAEYGDSWAINTLKKEEDSCIRDVYFLSNDRSNRVLIQLVLVQKDEQRGSVFDKLQVMRVPVEEWAYYVQDDLPCDKVVSPLAEVTYVDRIN